MKTDPIKFETVDSILNDPKCRSLIQEQLDSIGKEIDKIIGESKSGKARVKRTAYDTLIDMELTVDDLISEFKLIKLKKCQLAARERQFISYIVASSISGTLTFYMELEKAELEAMKARKAGEVRKTKARTKKVKEV